MANYDGVETDRDLGRSFLKWLGIGLVVVLGLCGLGFMDLMS